MNPANNYDVHGAAKLASHHLNLAIDQLKNGKHVDEGRKYMKSVINILSGMNKYYEENYIIGVAPDGSKQFEVSIIGSSACYKYSINQRNIAKLEECTRLLNVANPDLGFVIEVLKGNSELPNIK